MSVQKFSANSAAIEEYKAANQRHHEWVNGAEVIIYTGDDMPASQIVRSVTPRQIRLALTAAGMRTAVENAVKAGSQDIKDWWEYSLEIERGHPMIAAMCAQLGISDAQADAVFTAAAAL